METTLTNCQPSFQFSGCSNNGSWQLYANTCNIMARNRTLLTLKWQWLLQTTTHHSFNYSKNPSILPAGSCRCVHRGGNGGSLQRKLSVETSK